MYIHTNKIDTHNVSGVFQVPTCILYSFNTKPITSSKVHALADTHTSTRTCTRAHTRTHARGHGHGHTRLIRTRKHSRTRFPLVFPLVRVGCVNNRAY